MATEIHSFSNEDLAKIFERIAALLEIKGEVVFKIRAYQRAAESLRNEAQEAQVLYRDGKLSDIPGVGKAITEKIGELLTTGRLGFLERLEGEVPPSLLEMLQVPDVGPRRIALFWKEAGINNLAELEAAAREKRLQKLPGLGEKSEARILSGIEALARRSDRMSLEVAWSNANRWIHWASQQPGVQRVEPAGSLRRWRETVGDLDLIAACDDPVTLMESFVHHPDVERIIGHGDNKSSVELRGGVRIQLWAQPSSRFGTLWVYATGSKAHNIRLRELALKRGLSLSERGFEDNTGRLLEYPSEQEVYGVVGLPWLPPELREDRGEIEAGKKGTIPALIETQDLVSELHCHSTWSDGSASIAQMAQSAIERGLKLLCITDHSASLGIARGLTIEQLHQKRAEIDQIQVQIGDKLRLLHGAEVDILAEGDLDYPDDVLAGLDIVIASLHSSLRQPRDVITRRLVSAIRNPHVDLIAHPSGRLLPSREGADLDWDVVLAEAQQHGVAMEINASPYRLDLTDVYARRAIELGIPLAINTDAHSTGELDLSCYGVSVARRAWAESRHILNAWQPDQLVQWLKSRG